MESPAEAAMPPQDAQQQQAAQRAQRRVGSWALSTHIGAGSFAIVWRAQHVETGAEAAVKEINLSKLNSKLRQSLESEVSILKRIRHENIVQLLEVIEEEERLYLVMEFCAGGDLAHFLRRVKRVPEPVARHLMRQLAAGMRQMWAHHLVHRDLKPQNLLLSAAAPDATLKIADFGFARNLQPQGLAETLCGSPLYMAPEILHFRKYDAKADLWSIGAILYELVVGRPPFTGANQFQLLRNIERHDAHVPEAIAAQLSPPCRHLIHCLLRRNHVERLSFEEFFRHPFVATPEEAAAPLPPRAPFGGGTAPGRAGALGGIAASLAVGGSAPRQHPQLQQQQRGALLFSTSAPAAAAAAAAAAADAGARPRAGSAAANSVPQQVLGFQQHAAAGLRVGNGGAAGVAAHGSPGSLGAVVPVGGLSHQLKPRRSLDLDGHLAAPQQQQQYQQQQHLDGRYYQQQQQPGPRRPQPVAGRRLGSVQRVQGFQPAPLPGQPAWPPGVVVPTDAAAGAAAAALPPGGRPSSRQQQGPAPLPLAGAAPRSVAAGWGQAHAAAAAASGTSVDSEDDDYVLVDTLLSAHTAVGRGSKQGSLPMSRSASAEEREEGGSLATSSRHTTASTEEDIFAAQPADSHVAGGTASAWAPPAWLGGSRWRSLQRVALVLQAAAAARQGAVAGSSGLAQADHRQLRECLSLHLAALQVLEHALEAHSAAAAVAAAAELAPCGAEQTCQEMDRTCQEEEQGSCSAEKGEAAALASAALQLQQEAGDSMAAAEAAAAALDKAGRDPSPTSVTPSPAAAAAAAEAEEAELPDPWELLYAAALAWGREAAVDELLGNLPRSCQLYELAGTALSFLSAKAAGLELEPPVELAPADRARLQKYAAATAARWAACAGAADAASSSPTSGGGLLLFN